MKKIFFVLLVGVFFMITAYPHIIALGSDTPQPWRTITAGEARRIMAESDNYILLDVRTEAEFRERRIPGAILMPVTEISSRAEAELPDKDALILLYCQSGRRSASAAASLAALGYSNIHDLGGINSWPYEVVRE